MMPVPPHAKTTWRDEVSPTSPNGAKNLWPISSRRKTDATNALHEEDQTKILGLINGHADNASSATPLPLPPVPNTGDEQVETFARRRLIPRPPWRIITGPSANNNDDGEDLDEETAAQGVWHAAIDGSQAKTPTPTTAEFREMLSTYIGQEGEVERLFEMAERVSEHRVIAARTEERHNLLTSSLLTGDQRSAILSIPYPETHHAAFLSARSTNLPSAAFSASPLAGLSPLPTPLPITTTLQEIRLRSLSLRVNQRLLPAKMLLSYCARAEELPTLEQAKAAASYAYVALSYARSALLSVSSGDEGGTSENDEKQAVALQGRCAYYVALAEWVLAKRDGRQPYAWVLDNVSMGEKAAESVPLMSYFELACHAKEWGYVEGTWAAEWLEYLKGQPRMVTQDGERSWLEWLTSTLNPISVKQSSFRVPEDSAERTNPTQEDVLVDNSPQGNSPRRTSEQQRSTAYRRAWFFADNSISSRHSIRQARSPTDTGVPSHSSPPADRQANFELFEDFEQTLPIPVTSPRSHTRTTSLTFKVPESLQRRSPKWDERGPDGRRHSLLARVIGRERQKSEIQEADSPFQGWSDGDGDGSPKVTKRWSLKKRKASEEPEDIV